MIRPHKQMKFKYSPLAVSAVILHTLKTNNKIKYNDLVIDICKQIDDLVRPIILPSIELLYLLGKVDYDENSDMVVLLNETDSNI